MDFVVAGRLLASPSVHRRHKTCVSSPSSSLTSSASRSFVLLLACLYCFSYSAGLEIDDAASANTIPDNQVSIEGFYDLDDLTPNNVVIDSNKAHAAEDENQVGLGKGLLYEVNSLTKQEKPDASDDEDITASGSGSGSGDSELTSLDFASDSGTLTPTKGLTVSDGSQIKPEDILTSIKEGGSEDLEPTNDIRGNEIGGTEEQQYSSIESNNKIQLREGRTDLEDDIDAFDEDSVYDLSGAPTLTSNNIISRNKAAWLPWSKWQVVGSSAKVRVRTCQGEGQSQAASESSCKGARVQMRSCTDAMRGECGSVEDVKLQGQPSDSNCQPQTDQGIVQATSPQPATASTPSSPPFLGSGVVDSLPTHSPERACQFSLYDSHRHNFVFTRWNLTQVMSKSKLKKWCDKTSGMYVVMTTPTRTCRRLYMKLCQAAQKCRSSKPTRERGDFAEGCWRGLVYGDMLPVGLSNKQTIVYFICQRFAASSALGNSFGYKETHFGTLFDTQLRSPVLSLHKMTQVGDETWPETNYLIEYGLVEEKKDMLWLFRRPRKGMLTLADLNRCYDVQACDVGLRQVLPADYDLDQSRYVPTPLVWPEWMAPSPASRIATFTLTNTAPMLTTLYDEWQAKVRNVRRYAIEQCGIPYDATPNLSHVGHLSARRSHKAALYIASGVIPTQNPSKAIGRDVNVPFMFWMAGCCVQQHAVTEEGTNNNKKKKNGKKSPSYFSNLDDESTLVTNVTAFSMYIQNSDGSHAVAAPVLQLELLLQDMYKVKPSDPEVTLFPGEESACSELQNDVSRWFL